MLKIGMVGYGYWGPNLVRNLINIPDTKLMYICDLDKKNRDKASETYPNIDVIDNYSTVIYDTKVDAVVIATPMDTHYGLVKQALLAGKHVFVEKPMTVDVPEGQELIDLAKERNKILMVGHTFLYTGAVKKIKEIIDSGELGEIYHIRSARLTLGLFEQGKDIIWNIKRCRNVMWDFMPHDISLILYLLGNKKPEKIFATGSAHITEGIEDTAYANLMFGNINATIEASWLDAKKIRDFVIIGSKKMIVFDDTQNLEKVKIYSKGVESKFNSFGEWQAAYNYGDIVIPKVDNTEPIKVELQHFVDCVNTGTTPISDGINGLRVVEILNEIEKEIRK